jgi:hypothetical protein
MAVVLPAQAHAADRAGRELSGTYSSLRVEGTNLAGAGVTAAWPLGTRLHLRADATAQFGTLAGEDVTEWALLVGPSVALPRLGPAAPFVRAAVGVVRARSQVEIFGVAIGPDGVCSGGCPWQIQVAGEAGAGLDWRLSRRFALRLPQLDARLSSGASPRHRWRASAGIVWRWQ